jgi:DNA polymerase-3 subunit alpha
MNQVEKLKEYCKKMLMNFEFEEDCVVVNNDIYQIIVDSEEILFNDEMEFMPDFDENTRGWVYEFGGRWYLHNFEDKLALNELKNIGLPNQKIPTNSFLGIRSGYELMNGVGLYKDWISKAKFLGVKTLAICEKNSLSGALSFQKACSSAKIKSIFGMTISLIDNSKIDEEEQETFEVKLYVRDFQGWLNLLKFNSLINIDKESNINLEFLLDNREGLFIVADPKNMSIEKVFKGVDFYQLDTVIFTNADKDEEYYKNLEAFIKSELEPISITDAFYIEQDDYLAREALWDISKTYDFKSTNQFFKNKDEYAKEIISLFEVGNESWINLFKRAVKNETFLAENCNYNYDTNTRHLPRYIMTEEESRDFKTNEELFLFLIKKGFVKKAFPKEDTEKYISRLKMEIEVLKNGDVIDYFLTLYDIIKFARTEKMMTGIGRGSAGGSLVAYLLDIIKIDPIKFGLLFERFLNAGRMGSWVDCDKYVIELEDGSKIELIEGELIRVKRNNKETAVLVHELLEGDEIIRF